MKKLICLLLTLCLVFAMFAGCAKEPEVAESSKEPSNTVDLAKGKTVAICMGSVNHPVHRILQYGFMTKSEELNMNSIVSGLNEGSIVQMMEKWKEDISKNNVNGVALYTGDDSCYDMLKELKSQGIYTVVPYFFDHNYMDTKQFIDRKIAYTDEQFVGLGAKYIVEKLQEKGIESGTIGFTGSGIGAMEADIYREIFINELTKLGVSYDVTAACYEGAEITEATNKATKLLYDNPDMVAVFGTSGGSAQTWSTVMENQGINNLLVVCVDLTPINLDIVKQEKIDALIYRPGYHSAQKSAESLYGLLNGEVYNKSEEEWFLEVDSYLITSSGDGANGVSYYSQLLKDVEAYFE